MAFRVNLFSAVCAASTVGLVCDTARALLPAGPQTAALSVVAALTLAFSPLFWSQAVITEVYTLLALAGALTLWLAVQWRQGGSDGWLWLTGLTLGLGLGNHLTLALMVPPLLILLWPQRGRLFHGRTLLPATALFVFGLGIYSYLPLAARRLPAVNWGNPQVLDRFLWVVTGRQYQRFVFALEPALIPARLGTWAVLLGRQFSWWGLGLALAGVWIWAARDRAFAWFSAAWVGLVMVYAFFYGPGDSYVYLVPVLLAMALWWAMGCHYFLDLAGRMRRGWQRLAWVAILLLPAASLALNWQEVDLSHDWSGHSYFRQVLDSVSPGGLVIVRQDSQTFSLWYAVYAEGQRADVAVVNAPLLAYAWYRDQIRHLYPQLTVPEPQAAGTGNDALVRELIVRNFRQPVYATDPSEAWETWFEFVPLGQAPVYGIQLKTRWESEG